MTEQKAERVYLYESDTLARKVVNTAKKFGHSTSKIGTAILMDVESYNWLRENTYTPRASVILKQA